MNEGPEPASEPRDRAVEEAAVAPFVPTPEQIAERARRADKASRGVLAAVLGLEALVALLIPRTIAFTTGLGPVRTAICIGLAVVLVAAAGLVRRPWGIGLGSALQLVFFATGLLIVTMFLVAALFIAVWGRVLVFRHEIVGSPGGLRILAG